MAEEKKDVQEKINRLSMMEQSLQQLLAQIASTDDPAAEGDATVDEVAAGLDEILAAFLLDEPEFYATVSGFLEGAAEHRGLRAR